MDVPPDLYAFHCYTRNSATLYHTLVVQYPLQFPGRAQGFHNGLKRPPTHALRPVIPSNACTLRNYRGCWHEVSRCLFFGYRHPNRVLASWISFPTKGLYNPKAFFTHAVWLDQACAHCPIFPTAASRRSLDRVSVPVWLIILSDQLRIVALVGLYPAN